MHSQRIQELYREHAAALVLYARQWCCAPDDALQEAMLALANCDPLPHDPVAWLYTATKRRAMNIARGEARREQHHTRAAEGQSQWFALPDHNSEGRRAEELADSVVAGLETLADDERELVVARVWGNLAFEQLGQLLGCSASSAHRRYGAALSKLRSVVERELDESDPSSEPAATHSQVDEQKLIAGENP